MAAEFIFNVPVLGAASQSLLSAARRPVMRRVVLDFAAMIAGMTIRAVEFLLLCWVAIVLAFWVLVVAKFFF
jgi:hypothetical protein